MHHLLSPEEDGWSTTGEEFLSPADIITRIQKEFKNVTVDKPAGKLHVLERIKHLRGLQAAEKYKYWSKESIQAEIERLETLLDDTYRITIADSDDPGNAHLETVVMPNQ